MEMGEKFVENDFFKDFRQKCEKWGGIFSKDFC